MITTRECATLGCSSAMSKASCRDQQQQSPKLQNAVHAEKDTIVLPAPEEMHDWSSPNLTQVEQMQLALIEAVPSLGCRL